MTRQDDNLWDEPDDDGLVESDDDDGLVESDDDDVRDEPDDDTLDSDDLDVAGEEFGDWDDAFVARIESLYDEGVREGIVLITFT